MSEDYRSILQGLAEALDHAHGKVVGAQVRAVAVPVVNAAVRGGVENKLDPGSGPE